MKKTRIDLLPLLFPHSVVLVGADVDGKADFVTVAWATIACGTPPFIAIALNKTRHSLKGIRQNMTFSVNVPSRELVRETDYCGLISGARTDKSKDCNFTVSYGEVAGAPYIEQCPVNIGCEAEHIVRLGSHYLIAGAVKEILVAEGCLVEGKPDASKVVPFITLATPGLTYHTVGDSLGPAFRIGKEIKDIKQD
jgi:flavin reductase (DIM6/NTAB) family NADH-FMN oxidoreductase RutF